MEWVVTLPRRRSVIADGMRLLPGDRDMNHYAPPPARVFISIFGRYAPHRPFLFAGIFREGLRSRKPGEGRARAKARVALRGGVQQEVAPYDAPVATSRRAWYDQPSRANQPIFTGASSGER